MVFVSTIANWLSEAEKAKVSQAVELLKDVYGDNVFANDNLISIGRHVGFMQDEDFMRAYDAECLTPQNKSLVWRLHILSRACENALKLNGDFVECGVFKALKSAFLCNYMQFDEQSDRQFYLYDTFNGIPEKYAAGSPISPKVHQREGLLDYVHERFAQYSNVNIIQGIVPDCLQENAPTSVAYLHLDMNSASAEYGALEYFFPKMTPGAWIILDDYGWKEFGPQKHVADKFFNARGYTVTELPTGQGLVVVRPK